MQMKKTLYVLVCSLFCFLGATASPGDTTWVQAHNGVWLDGYGSYDTTITFPTGATSYRKIYMIFTLGKHQCPGNPQWCGDWDYTVQNYLMTPTGDTLELARLITPYANAGAPRTPWTWTQRYIYDVTDYYTVLKNSATMRIFYSGYSGGFTGNIKFAFIEGTPDRDVKGIARLWNGSFGFGNAIPIDTNFQALTKTAPAGTQTAAMKFTITGHGSDNTQCCEFQSKYYDVLLNSTQVDHKDIWRNDCGSNELYPQSGTWLYERANWCPGALVRPNIHQLPGVVGGNNFNVEINFQPYTSNGGGSYTTEAQVFYYGALNKTVDASLDDIVAPSNYEGYYRENPACGTPTIKIKNTGSTAITSIHFQYGADNLPLADYTWTANLASLHDTTLLLPHLPYLDTISGNNLHTFRAKIVEVNGLADNDATNDSISSYFKPSPKWPYRFCIQLKTNEAVDNFGNSETKWQILTSDNQVVAERATSSPSTIYNDTINMFAGCYKLVVTDGSCDGLSWWVYNQNPGPGIPTAGYFTVYKIPGPGTIPVPVNPGTANYHDDFGCGFTQYFTTDGMFPAGVTNLSEIPLTIEAFPNPAYNTVSINISGVQNVAGTIKLIDALGRVVIEKECNSAQQVMDVSSLSNGAYTVVFIDKDEPSAKLQTRLMIAK